MAKLIVTTTPQQVLPPNPRRTSFEIQYVPASVIATNTGLVFLAINKIPSANSAGENNEHILISGASLTRALALGDSVAEVTGALWAISDTADQQLTLKEFLAEDA